MCGLPNGPALGMSHERPNVDEKKQFSVCDTGVSLSGVEPGEAGEGI